MLHPDTRLQFIDEDIGYGIFATNFIPAGTITYVKDALEIELDAETYKSTMLYLNTGHNYQSVKVLQYCPPLVQAGNQHY
jgi:hypothetical protein